MCPLVFLATGNLIRLAVNQISFFFFSFNLCFSIKELQVFPLSLGKSEVLISIGLFDLFNSKLHIKYKHLNLFFKEYYNSRVLDHT